MVDELDKQTDKQIERQRGRGKHSDFIVDF